MVHITPKAADFSSALQIVEDQRDWSNVEDSVMIEVVKYRRLVHDVFNASSSIEL